MPQQGRSAEPLGLHEIAPLSTTPPVFYSATPSLSAFSETQLNKENVLQREKWPNWVRTQGFNPFQGDFFPYSGTEILSYNPRLWCQYILRAPEGNVLIANNHWMILLKKNTAPWFWSCPALGCHTWEGEGAWIKEQMWKARCWSGQPKKKVRVQKTLPPQPQVFCTLTRLKGFALTNTQTCSICSNSKCFRVSVVSLFGMKRHSGSIEKIDMSFLDSTDWILEKICHKHFQFCTPNNVSVCAWKWSCVCPKKDTIDTSFEAH